MRLGPVDLRDVDAGNPQRTCKPDGVGARAFDADPSDGPEGLQPRHQESVAVGILGPTDRYEHNVLRQPVLGSGRGPDD